MDETAQAYQEAAIRAQKGRIWAAAKKRLSKTIGTFAGQNRRYQGEHAIRERDIVDSAKKATGTGGDKRWTPSAMLRHSFEQGAHDAIVFCPGNGSWSGGGPCPQYADQMHANLALPNS